jgi:hypothetical protein
MIAREEEKEKNGEHPLFMGIIKGYAYCRCAVLHHQGQGTSVAQGKVVDRLEPVWLIASAINTSPVWW